MLSLCACLHAAVVVWKHSLTLSCYWSCRLHVPACSACQICAFLTADLCYCWLKKAQVLLIALAMALFYLSVPVSNNSVTVSQH